MTEQQKKQNENINQAKKLGRFFELKVQISMFGNIIFEWVFPPKKED